jgi:GNAT superfamily N-acetyltransferase
VNEAMSNFVVREWSACDDDALRSVMRAQMEIDPGWPPPYAREADLAEWLAKPANLGRWVANDASGTPVGHVGIGAVRPGPLWEAWQSALHCDLFEAVEICRMIVDPRVRGRGLAALLTRKALRASIEAGRIPVSSVLVNRGSWLAMMLETGWRSVGIVKSSVSDGGLVALIAPQRFVDAAVRMRRSR